MSIANCINGRTEPLLQVLVHLSQYIKITQKSQPLGAFQMQITPSGDDLILSFQNPPSAPVLSLPLGPKFAYVVQEKSSWKITDTRNKQWIVEFKDDKDMSRALCLVGLVLNYKDESLLKYDLPGQDHNGKEINNGDRIQITYYVYTFSDFPYIDKLYLCKENLKTKLNSQHLAKGLVQGMAGMTCSSSRVIFVPASLAASDHTDQQNPIDNLVFYVTLKHAKYAGDAQVESEHTEAETETEEAESQPEPKETKQPEEENSETTPSEEEPKNEPTEKPEKSGGIMSRIKKMGGMPMGMMGMPISYEKKHQQAKEEAAREAEEAARAAEEQEEEIQKEEPIKAETKQPPKTEIKSPSKTESKPQSKTEIKQPQKVPSMSKQSPPKRGLFDQPREADDAGSIKRFEQFERTIDSKLSLICGSPTDRVDPDQIIRGISSIATQYKLKTQELETLKKQAASLKAKSSGAAASTRQLENAKAELNEVKKMKPQLESKSKAIDMKLKEIERTQVEASDTAKEKGIAYVKSMMSKVFDDMNNKFSANASYTGAQISEALFDLLRSHAYSTIEQIEQNGLF